MCVCAEFRKYEFGASPDTLAAPASIERGEPHTPQCSIIRKLKEMIE